MQVIKFATTPFFPTLRPLTVNRLDLSITNFSDFVLHIGCGTAKLIEALIGSMRNPRYRLVNYQHSALERALASCGRNVQERAFPQGSPLGIGTWGLAQRSSCLA